MDLKRLMAKSIKTICNPPALTNCKINNKSRVCSGTQINNSTMNKYSYCGHDCFILNCEIGSFVSIADNCRLGGATHPIERVSSSPVFHKGKNILGKNFIEFDDIISKKTVIKSDVWIGAGAIVLSGVTIGVGAVVGAGSVVTHDIPAYEVWAGNPAKKIRKRFEDEVIKGLLKTGWWEWDDKKIKAYSYLFDNPKEFIAGIREE